MVVVSYSGKEINAKLVYYGPGLSGKTSNLEYVYQSVPSSNRGKMVSMKTRTERTLFFDFLPVDLGELGGFKTRFLLYTVPGQVYYNATRKLVLRGVDAIIFVADSQRGKMEENIESLENLHDNLKEYGLSLDEIPMVIQYNKRDLPDVYSIEELNEALNPEGFPVFEAVATTGQGVFETFRGIARILLQKLSKEVKLGPSKGAAAVAEVTPQIGGRDIPASAPAMPPGPAAGPASPTKPEPEVRTQPQPGQPFRPGAVAPQGGTGKPFRPGTPAPATPAPMGQQDVPPPAPIPFESQEPEPVSPAPIPFESQEPEPVLPAPIPFESQEPVAPAPPSLEEITPPAPTPPEYLNFAPADPAPAPVEEPPAVSEDLRPGSFEPLVAPPAPVVEPTQTPIGGDAEPNFDLETDFRPTAPMPDPAAPRTQEPENESERFETLSRAKRFVPPGHEEVEEDEEKPGFWGRLFKRGGSEHDVPVPPPAPPAPVRRDATQETRLASVEIPAVGGSGSESPIFIERRIQVPITLGPEEIARGARLRLILEINVASAEAEGQGQNRVA